MKSTRLLSFGICLSLLIWSASISFAETPTSISQMNKAASEQPLSVFIQAVHSNRWNAPIIYSKWHIENRQQFPEMRRQSEKARSFGRVLACRLDEAATGMISRTGTAETVSAISQLLDLSEWLTGVEGYGNLFLAARCQDIATVGLGRLTADLAFPFATVSVLVARLDSPWRSSSMRARVLNAEVGTNLFPTVSQAADLAQKQLDDIWQNGEMVALKHRSSEIEAVLAGKNPPGFEAVSQMVAARPVKLVETPIFTENVGFFCDDAPSEWPRPTTTVNLWDIKRHRKLVIGLDSVSMRNLKALLVFRQNVKEFPLHPMTTPEQDAAAKAETAAAAKKGIKLVPFESFYSSPQAAAFAQAWQHYATEKTRNLDAAAWQAYKEITSGEFVDEDTKAKRLGAQIKAAPDPNAR